MKYRSVSWNLMINDEQANFDDNALEIISKEIENGNTSGFFTCDCTDFGKCSYFLDKLADIIGRDIDCSIEDDDKGELDELLSIAKKKNDNEIVDIIEEILKNGFED